MGQLPGKPDKGGIMERKYLIETLNDGWINIYKNIASDENPVWEAINETKNGEVESKEICEKEEYEYYGLI